MASYGEKVFSYIPEQIKVYVDAYEVTGLISITATKDEDSFKLVKGIRGKNTRVRQKNNSYTVQLELQQVDPVNDFLTDVHLLDTQSDGVGYFNLLIQDLNGTTRFSSDTAYIQKIPDIQYSLDFNNRTWVIRTLDVAGIFLGGNDILSSSPNFNQLNTELGR